MLHPHNNMLPQPSSPTNSSLSSSDLDTESTGSFFHDRSTTLGTLMGVNFPAIPPFTTPSRGHAASSEPSIPKPKKKKPSTAAERRWRRRRRWWTLCPDGGSKPASLGEFLEVERRFGDEMEASGRALFADGRVLPPAVEDTAESGGLCGFPVMLCSGGVA